MSQYNIQTELLPHGEFDSTAKLNKNMVLNQKQVYYRVATVRERSGKP